MEIFHKISLVQQSIIFVPNIVCFSRIVNLCEEVPEIAFTLWYISGFEGPINKTKESIYEKGGWIRNVCLDLRYKT